MARPYMPTKLPVVDPENPGIETASVYRVAFVQVHLYQMPRVVVNSAIITTRRQLKSLIEALRGGA